MWKSGDIRFSNNNFALKIDVNGTINKKGPEITISETFL
jgi:hypothetical protein